MLVVSLLTLLTAPADAVESSASAQREAVSDQAPTSSSNVVLDGALAPYLRVALGQSPDRV